MPESYKDTIDSLRKQRTEQRKAIGVYTYEIEQTLNKFAIDAGDSFIPISEFMHLNVGEPFYVNEKVHFIRQETSLERVIFMTYVKAGGSFGLQSHDVPEICKIIRGHLIEAERGDKVYGEGKEIYYAPYEEHKPYALVDSVYEVTFKLDNKNNTPAKL